VPTLALVLSVLMITRSGRKPTKMLRPDAARLPAYVPESTRIGLGPLWAASAVNVGSGATYFRTRTQSSTMPLATVPSFQLTTRRLTSGMLAALVTSRTWVPSWWKRTPDKPSRSKVQTWKLLGDATAITPVLLTPLFEASASCCDDCAQKVIQSVE
jgi:hypothetical protein